MAYRVSWPVDKPTPVRSPPPGACWGLAGVQRSAGASREAHAAARARPLHRPPLLPPAAARHCRRLLASSATCSPPPPPSTSTLSLLEQGYREDDGLYLESDTDEQLLIHIPFNTACKLQGLVIKSTKAPEQVLPGSSSAGCWLLG